MKKTVVSVLFVLFCTYGIAQRKEFKEIIKKELSYDESVTDKMLEVQNLNGSVSIEGYDGKVVLIEVEKKITAKNTEDLELGKKEIGVNVLREDGKLIVYPQVPNMHYENGKFTSIDCNRWEQPEYDHSLNFKVKMPRNSDVKVGAINNGEVSVKNTKGSYIEANNINGGIELVNITGKTKVYCINGKVDISYAANPVAASTYYSLNGDINITYQKNLSAEISFKSMNGDLYTDFDISKQYAKTSKNESGNKGKVKFKFEARPIVQIGDGALFHDFETLNGDVIIKKI